MERLCERGLSPSAFRRAGSRWCLNGARSPPLSRATRARVGFRLSRTREMGDSSVVNYSSSFTRRNFANCRSSIAPSASRRPTISVYTRVAVAVALRAPEKWSVFSDTHNSSGAGVARACIISLTWALTVRILPSRRSVSPLPRIVIMDRRMPLVAASRAANPSAPRTAGLLKRVINRHPLSAPLRSSLSPPQPVRDSSPELNRALCARALYYYIRVLSLSRNDLIRAGKIYGRFTVHLTHG